MHGIDLAMWMRDGGIFAIPDRDDYTVKCDTFSNG